jgi:hypothetical protein
MTDWQKYEDSFHDFVSNNFKDSTYEKNAKVLGTESLVKRQIDILAKGKLAGKDVTCAIECKYLNKRVDVKVVDSMIGFCIDVRANLGILVTKKGFTKAAINRAENSHVDIRTVEFGDLPQYRIEWDMCEVCGEGDFFPLIDWQENGRGEYKIGHCLHCTTLHVKCEKCGSYFDELSMQSKSGRPECYCGYKYYFQPDNDPNGDGSGSVTRKK